MLRTGRAPVYAVVVNVTAGQQGGEETAFLISDVVTNTGSVINDNISVTVRIEPKNPTIEATAINAVTFTRYHVDYRRTDGRNRPGVDVPYGFDGGVSRTIPSGSEGTLSFEIVRHQAKEEPPLASLAGGGGLRFLSVIAEVTLFGRDQNGNELTVRASMDIHFADFVDEDE